MLHSLWQIDVAGWLHGLWDFLNSQFLSTVSGAVVAIAIGVFGQRVTRSNEEVAAQEGAQSASQQALSIEAAVANMAEPPEAGPGEIDVRPQAKGIVEDAKHYLDGVASEARDGRHRRTYEAISRYDYIPLAVALNVRQEIDTEQLAAAVSLFSLWKQYERGTAARKRVPNEILRTMQDLLRRLTAA